MDADRGQGVLERDALRPALRVIHADQVEHVARPADVADDRSEQDFEQGIERGLLGVSAMVQLPSPIPPREPPDPIERRFGVGGVEDERGDRAALLHHGVGRDGRDVLFSQGEPRAGA